MFQSSSEKAERDDYRVPKLGRTARKGQKEIGTRAEPDEIGVFAGKKHIQPG